LEIINLSPFQFANIAGRIGFPKHSLSVIIKGTFDLANEKLAVSAEEQIGITGDELYEDDDEGQGCYRYDSDFAYFKPNADLLLTGNCHPPGGIAATSCRATFRVGPYAKSLAVFGDRYWQGNSPSHPETFTIMPLKYENSFGGNGFKKNPVGKGIGKVLQKDGSLRLPLPNIENIHQLILSTNHRPDPVGYGPLGRMWQERFSKLGSYKGAWLKEQWPWFPRDFDWRHYNAAPTDMQVNGYLRGDEELYFENLHPVHSDYRTKLPGYRIRLFINEGDQRTGVDANFKEIKLNLDTLWVDMEAENLVLLWRGITPVLSEDYDEIQHIFIVDEKIEEPEQPIDIYHDLFLKILAEEELDEAYEVKPINEVEAEDITEIDEEIAKAEAHIRASLIEEGIDPDNLPEPTPEQKEEEAKILKEMGYEEEIEPPLLTRELIIEGVKQGESFANEDLNGLDLSNLKMDKVNLQSAILSGVNFTGSDLSGARLVEANLSQANLSNANLLNIDLTDADLTGARLTEANLTGAKLGDAVFEKTAMNKANLDRVSAENTVFSESNLTEATFRNSFLGGADFSNCRLDRTDFQGAYLSEASVEGATGIQINMAETNLTELRASSGCNFSNGSFRQATGKESMWDKANLTGADYRGLSLLLLMKPLYALRAWLRSAPLKSSSDKIRLSRDSPALTLLLTSSAVKKADIFIIYPLYSFVILRLLD